MSQALVTFNDFMSLPVLFFNSIGVNPYDTPNYNITKNSWFFLYFLFNMFCVSVTVSFEIGSVFVALNSSDHFLEVSMLSCYIAFAFACETKIITMWWQKCKLNALVNDMEKIFPSHSIEVQQNYKVPSYLQHCRRISKFVSYLYMVLIVTYILFMIVQFVIHKWILHSPDATLEMPFTSYSLWNLDNSLVLVLTYVMESFGGYTSAAGNISSDLLLYALVMQNIMHFDYLTKTLKEMNVQDLELLQKLISYHNQLLLLTDAINSVFGISILLNFLASSITVCFVGFQMTVGLNPEQVIKLAVFLVSATIEIFLFCYFSDLLIVASSKVFYAVYEMNWVQADNRFKKMLLIMAARAQKPKGLQATIFLEISMQTMSMFLQTTYRFFCVIRTMYQ